ncbi:MAG: hypothetical protein JWO36_3036 [Myxococcales bacterium]|nr:hypothetical protein [Myxococcales bacterium]
MLVFALACCGRGSAPPPEPEKVGSAAPARDAPQLEIAAVPLGMPDLGSFGWRKRPGHAAFRAARKAEDHEDWPGVVTACKQALAADPGHLEAAWLLAVGLAKTGKLDEVLPPLQTAATGDFGKWAQASLEQPALQPFLATATGLAWQRRLEEDRQVFLAALARSIVVNAGGDLYAYDPQAKRWHRLTRTWGAVIGGLAVPAAHRIAYVTRGKIRAPKIGKSATQIGIGLVDLTRGKTLRQSEIGAAGPFTISYSANPPGAFWIGPTWRSLDDEGRLRPLPAKTTRPPGTWLEVLGHSVRIHRLPVASVSADWDEQSLASAIRIGTSNRVVAAPSPGLVDGNTATWSPDRAHLAFVAIDDHCTPGAASAAAFVADAATGSVHELERAHGGLAIEWISDRQLAIAGDHGVSIIELGSAATPIPLVGANDLAAPRRKPRCTPEPIDEPVEVDPSEANTSDEPLDAGTAH